MEVVAPSSRHTGKRIHFNFTSGENEKEDESAKRETGHEVGFSKSLV